MKLRTKTMEALENHAIKIDMNPDDVISLVEKFIKNFVTWKEYEAYNFILRLKITPVEIPDAVSEASRQNFKTLEDVLADANLESIGLENVQKVCGDLAAAYKESHPSCWLAKKADYPVELRNALQDDLTLLAYIKEKCQEAANFDSTEIKRILYLTSGSTENLRFGGLRAMKFSPAAANKLKDVANQISKYFNSFIPDKTINTTIPIPADFVPSEETHNETAPTEEILAQNNQSVPRPSAPATRVISDVTPPPIEESTLTADNIIANCDAIAQFLETAEKLKNHGINPAEVLENIDKVQTLLNAVAAFPG